MPFEKIETETKGDIGIIRLNDPAVLNAVSASMIEELDQALDAALSSARVILLTGTGRAFCSGANLTGGLLGAEIDPEGPDFGAPLETHINPLMIKLRDLPVPIISAVRGAAAGVGCSLALAADIVIASDTAYFLQAFARVGLVPDGGSAYLLSRAVGRVRAMEMMLLGERVPAQQAREWGLINRVVADETLDAEALELAARLAKGPTRTLSMVRKIAWSALDSHLAESLQMERELQRVAGRTPDAAEGIAAFLAKRPAVFKGK